MQLDVIKIERALNESKINKQYKLGVNNVWNLLKILEYFQIGKPPQQQQQQQQKLKIYFLSLVSFKKF